MKLLSSILDSSEKLVGSVGEAFDKNFTNKEEQIEVKVKLLNEVNKLVLETQKAQLELISLEATGNKLQRSWRPIVMLCFAGIVIYAFFVQPAFFTDAVEVRSELPEEFWDLLKIGMGGYIIGRSGEKIAKSVSETLSK